MADNYIADEVQSDDFSDFDEPYHETASEWMRRSARRRARRLAGISSCSSSSSDESIDDGGDMTCSSDAGRNKALKPIRKWLRQYPIAAARACLSLADLGAATGHNSTRSPRERECSRLHRIFQRIHRHPSIMQRHHQGEEDSAETTLRAENDKLVIESFLPRGTGISIVDAMLSSETRRSSSSLVFEMTGNRRSGKTTTLVAIAARYVASTTNSFFCEVFEADLPKKTDFDIDQEHHQRPPKRLRRQESNYVQTSKPLNEPRVVILDIDLCMDPIKLMLAIRAAVLRRFYETSTARAWIRDLSANNSAAGSSTVTNKEQEAHLHDDLLSSREQKLIESAIATCLGRINVVQPRDFSYLSLVATLEGLRQSLDHNKHDNRQKQPPTLIMIDSISTLDSLTQFQESLPAANGSHSGLSDRNEFFRQLIRLCDSHAVAIIGTSLTTSGRCSIWEKMITHRVSFERE